jgi:tyrosyl-tRNA synthetase
MTEEQKLQELDQLFLRGVADFVDPDGSFRKKLEGKIKGQYDKDVVIKFGVDPNRPDIHLGHAVVLHKLRKFQDLGCKVVFLIGGFTAQIGDPTGKSKVRPLVEQKEVQKNMKTYLDQVGKILREDASVFAWTDNLEWFINITDLAFPVNSTVNIGFLKNIPANTFLGKAAMFEKGTKQKQFTNEIQSVTLRTFLSVLGKITHSQLISRDMFQKRLKDGEELYMHEMMYPVLQGIDSYVLAKLFGSCDLEVGGSDQHFNMLMGRDVMKMNKQDPQAVLSFDLLEGTDGAEKMSKSLDNYIGITDEPSDMYGKVMSVPDALLVRYFELCTFIPREDIESIKMSLEDGSGNPRDIKMSLAKQITEIYHGRALAEKAEQDFVQTFQEGGLPENITEIETETKPLVDVFVENNLLSSKTEFRRRADNGALKNAETGERIDKDAEAENMIIKYGKKDFVKITVK